MNHRPFRPSARSRLALLYTVLVVAAGAVLIGLTYFLVRRSLEARPAEIGLASTGSDQVAAVRAQASGLFRRLHDEALSELLAQSALALAIVAVLAAVLGWVIAGRVLRPIRAVSATARRLSAENLSERVPVSAPADELATLAVTINGMLDRIQSGVADRDRLLNSQRMFVANAAHELRTPLTTMRTALDVTLDGEPSQDELLTMAADISVAVDHSRQSLDGLLVLARSQIGLGQQSPADLAQVAADVSQTIGDQAAARDITIYSELLPAPVTGEPALLCRMAANLVDNAIRHNHPGGRITVTTGVHAERAVLRVANTGPSIAPEETNGLFEPFVRGAAHRTRSEGLGLGLSIVRAIAAAHHAEISCFAHPAGGLDIAVRFTMRTSAEGSA